MFFHNVTECFPNILNRWPHTECFSIRTTCLALYRMFFKTCIKWMAPYRMFIHTCIYMDGHIQYVFPHILNGWPHTECFSIRTTWVAPYRMLIITCLMDGPIQYDYLNVLNGWTHTECFSKHTTWVAPYTMLIIPNILNRWPHTV